MKKTSFRGNRKKNAFAFMQTVLVIFVFSVLLSALCEGYRAKITMIRKQMVNLEKEYAIKTEVCD